uniref:Uncharacterized protein n=1 Tax=Candidatus Kentrum sp. FW TaxID=2126338 RepID=A0A450TNZ9_9GAMM|nr:MAG: hypothetical protein BECKFW1821C_GA0114237_101919 [Candidatus Kentron sp. FW]
MILDIPTTTLFISRSALLDVRSRLEICVVEAALRL